MLLLQLQNLESIHLIYIKSLKKKLNFRLGLKQNGAITVASSEARLQELLRQATSAQLFDVNVEGVR